MMFLGTILKSTYYLICCLGFSLLVNWASHNIFPTAVVFSAALFLCLVIEVNKYNLVLWGCIHHPDEICKFAKDLSKAAQSGDLNKIKELEDTIKRKEDDE